MNDRKASFFDLGPLHWNPQTDQFQFKIYLKKIYIYDKRRVLSHFAQIFDQFGLTFTHNFSCKVIHSEAFKALQSRWDDQLPQSLQKEWTHFIENLSSIEKMWIPWWILAKLIWILDFKHVASVTPRQKPMQPWYT